jgi:hypothetical protein
MFRTSDNNKLSLSYQFSFGGGGGRVISYWKSLGSMYEITLMEHYNGKTYKVTELYNHITVIVTNVSAC